jgi:ABC-type multidrug transport system fused ATPase/permease subunit
MSDARGFVLVSHRIDELGACDRILVLDDGRVVEDGRPDELLVAPSSRYRAFIEARMRVEEHGS